jgi:hypothetical protein
MAIVKTTDTDQELLLKVTNGDLAALKELQKKWKFKKIEDIIRFALAVMVKSDDVALTINQDGKSSTLSPANELLEPEKQENK